ncbi:MAG: hypothetical protein VW580_06275 [Flavobacteriaceae bacterium]
MHDYETGDEFLKRCNNNFFYFLWGPSNPPHIFNDMQEKNKPKGFYVVGPEEWEPVEIFPNTWEFYTFKEYAKNHNIDFAVFIGAIKDLTYNKQSRNR